MKYIKGINESSEVDNFKDEVHDLLVYLKDDGYTIKMSVQYGERGNINKYTDDLSGIYISISKDIMDFKEVNSYFDTIEELAKHRFPNIKFRIGYYFTNSDSQNGMSRGMSPIFTEDFEFGASDCYDICELVIEDIIKGAYFNQYFKL